MVGDVPPAPDAGGGTASFEALLTAYRDALMDDGAADAAALLTAHAAAVHAADAAGYARAMGEVDVAFDRLASIDGDTLDSLAVDCRRYGPTPHVALSRDVDGWRIRAGYYFCDGIDSIAELLAVAAATLTDTAHADPPALVNGGPARDALDDGR